jgi:hypothetical protein
MANLSTFSVTLGATDYPVKYAGLLAYVEPYLTNVENFSFPGSGAVSIAGAFSAASISTTGDSQAASFNGGQLAGMRNKIINGKAELAQRGTSFAAVADGAYTLDRWRFGNTSAAVVTISQQSDVPADNEFQNSLRVAVTTADATIAAGDTCFISQRIEGYNVRDLIGRTFTLRFRVRSSKTGVHCIAFRNSGLNRSYVAEYTVSAANTWESKTITLTGGLITAGTWDWTNGTGLEVCFVLAAGSTFQTTAGAWQTGNFLDTANQVNCLDTIGNIFAITGVQLEPGGVAAPFEHRPIGVELYLCYRYFQSLPNFTFVTTSEPANVNARTFFAPMRASPTMTGTPASGTGAVVGAASGGYAGAIGGYGQIAVHSALASVTGVTASAEL